MKILILGNSDIFKRKIYYALKKFRNIEIEIASRKKIDKNLRIKKHYYSYSDAIEKTEAKIVYISLINSEHYHWGLKALNKNKHVIIDKPFTLNFKSTKKLLNLAYKKKLLLSESIVFHEHMRFKKTISKINLDKKTKIFCKFNVPRLKKNNFRNYKKYGGGCFHDMSPYAAYLIYFFFKNKRYSLICKKKINKNFLIKSFNLTVRSKNIVLEASFSFNSAYKNEILIYNKSKIYFLNFAFSPPINKSLKVEIFDTVKKEKYKINYVKQNVFHTYFSHLFKVISNKKYNHFYKEIKNIAKIKNEIYQNKRLELFRGLLQK
jgi:predicted dehydrogenase